MHTSVYFWGAGATLPRHIESSVFYETPIHTFMYTPHVHDQLTKAQNLPKLLWSGLHPKLHPKESIEKYL